ncbi:MAG: hypothetical protein ABIT76_11725 [Chthoniobacterales bacterium]
MNLTPLCRWLAVFLFTLPTVAPAAEWQWSVPVPPMAGQTEQPRAYLWIPPNCQRVRGVIFGHNNMEEEGVLEHPTFRKAAADLGFAEVWVAPGFDRNFRFDLGAGERFDAMLQALATQSGYTELTTAPLVPVGHSAAASTPWYIAAWKPERVLAGISFSGQWPYVPDVKEAPQVAGRSVDTVPGLVTAGEYEWADESMSRGLKTKADHPQMPLSGLGCPADGHFAATDEKVEFLALYLRKAAQYRLPQITPKVGPVTLNAIDPTKTGWLVDRYQINTDPSAPAAPVGEYKGDPAQAFWYFDGEIAQAAEAFQKKHRGQAALVGYVQNGEVVPQRPGTHPQVWLKFLPEADGVTFHLTGAFIDTVPGGRPTRWTGKKEGEIIEKPAGNPPVEIRRITGPVRQISADTWILDLNRSSLLGDRRGNDAWFVATWPGDAKFKRPVQQSTLQIPVRNADGQPQKIDFHLPAQIHRTASAIQLTATADSGLPVYYFVREGPATIDGNTLKLTALPPRAKFPVTITVIAWQWGRSLDPKVQTAEPVEQAISLVP